jgi:hypothetical protein
LLQEGSPEHTAGKLGGDGRGWQTLSILSNTNTLWALCLSIFLFLVNEHALRNRSTFHTDSRINNQHSSESAGHDLRQEGSPEHTAGKLGGNGRGALCLSSDFVLFGQRLCLPFCCSRCLLLVRRFYATSMQCCLVLLSALIPLEPPSHSIKTDVKRKSNPRTFAAQELDPNACKGCVGCDRIWCKNDYASRVRLHWRNSPSCASKAASICNDPEHENYKLVVSNYAKFVKSIQTAPIQ